MTVDLSCKNNYRRSVFTFNFLRQVGGMGRGFYGARTMLGQAESRNKRNRIYIFTNNGNTASMYAFKKPLSTYSLPAIAIMFSISCLIMQLLLVLSFSSCSSVLLVHQTNGAKTEQTQSANYYLVH